MRFERHAKINGNQAADELLRVLNRCDWSTMDGECWSELLSSQPQFADYCDWNKLDEVL